MNVLDAEGRTFCLLHVDIFVPTCLLGLGSVRLFTVSATGSRIFVGCQLLSSRRVNDWVSTYHSWEQPRCPFAISNLKALTYIYRPDPDPPSTRRQVLDVRWAGGLGRAGKCAPEPVSWRWRRDTSAAPRSDKRIPSRPPSCLRVVGTLRLMIS